MSAPPDLGDRTPDPPSNGPGAIVLRADWVAAMDRPPLRGGAVAFRGGRIAAVGEAAAVLAGHPGAEVHDLGRAVLLPALVNAHVHLELSDLTPPTPGEGPTSFVEWLMRVMRSAAPPGEAGRERVMRATEAGVAQCLRFGVTTVGDVTRRAADTRPVLRRSPLRGVSFGEIVGMAGRAAQLEGLLAAAADRAWERPGLQSGLEPHAPYSLDLVGFRRCVVAAARLGLPVTTHLAESPDEAAFLARHEGPFRGLWDAIGGWSDDVSRSPAGPIAAMREVGLLDLPAAGVPVLLAHVNYCGDSELDVLAAGRASVVYCPRTHAYFRHPPHRWRRMLERGVNVAVGTDSCASSPDLNLVDDLRLLRRLAPDLAPSILWEMATLRAARALGMERDVGTLAPGKAADCVAFPVSGDDPLAEVLDRSDLPTQVWIAGRRVAPRELAE